MINETKTPQTAEVMNAAAASVAKNMDGLSEGIGRATAGFEQTQAKLLKNTETAMTKAAELTGGNIAALNSSGQIWMAGIQDLSHQMAAAVHASIEETAGIAKSLMTVKSLGEVIDLQTGFARTTLERAMAQSERLARASLELTEKTLAPVTERVRATGKAFAV